MTETRNRQLLTEIERLMAKGEHQISVEEDARLGSQIDLVHDYERRRYPIPPSPPHEMVGYLMEQRGLSPAELVPVLGTRSRVSEVLAGKRGVSKEQAKKLAAFFEVGVELFL